MVTLGMLWMPILLAAVVVFFASFLMWMVLPHHRSDYKRFPNEAAVAEVLRKQSLAPMQYTIPHCGSPKDMKDPAFIKKLEEGPVATLTVMPSGQPSMGKAMALSFVWNLLVSVVVGYLAGRTLAFGSEYLAVFRVAGTAAVLGYSGALFPQSIWMGKPWSTVIKEAIDGIVYGLLTAGVFGWLWPR